jgi:hypothetical protein
MENNNTVNTSLPPEKWREFNRKVERVRRRIFRSFLKDLRDAVSRAGMFGRPRFLSDEAFVQAQIDALKAAKRYPRNSGSDANG